MSAHATDSICHPARDDMELGAVLHALSDPVRLRIIAELAHANGEFTCGSFSLPVTKSTCTHHFKVLREAGLLQQRCQGTTRLNRLRQDDLEMRFPGLLTTILQAAQSAGADAAAEAAEAAGAANAAERPGGAARATAEAAAHVRASAGAAAVV